MAKIMLVEDDNNLREIYEARLLAEGYEIVSAEDGEQALALAVKEKPDLIISDVMMPKISGFDMLDILRSTPETRNTKVIMMTALSQAEDKARADKLGADRYLVKSQVTLEDVAKVAREVLQDEDTVPAAAVATPAPAPHVTAAEPGASPGPAPAPAPAVPVAEPPQTPPVSDDNASATTPPAAATPEPPQAQPTSDPGGSSPAEPPKPTTPDPVAPPAPVGTQTTASETADIQKQITDFVQNMPGQKPAEPPVSAPAPAATPQPAPAVPVQDLPVAQPPATSSIDATNTAADDAATMASAANDLLQKANAPQPAEIKPTEQLSSNQIAGKKIIKPLNDLSSPAGPDLNALLAKEMANEQVVAPPPAPAAAPSARPSPGSTAAIGIAPVSPPPTPPVAPPSSADEQPVDIKPPGNVVQPGPDDPNNIAL
jgi:CheY-like chemotaxis protein